MAFYSTRFSTARLKLDIQTCLLGPISPQPSLTRLSLIACVNVVAFLLRAPDAVRQPQFWAEDGSVFFSDSHDLGLGSIVTSFAGYMHFVPRIAALISTLFSAVEAPTLYLIFSVVVIVWTSITIATCSTRLSCLYALLLMTPPYCTEIICTLTNVQWFMQIALLLVVVTAAPQSRTIRRNQALYAACASLTGPFSVFILPLAIARLFEKRGDRHIACICITVILGAIVQIFYLIDNDGYLIPGSYRPVHLFRTILNRWYGQLANGTLDHSRFGTVLALIVCLAGLLVLLRREKLYVYFYAYIIIALGATWLKYLHDSDSLNQIEFANRYFYGARLLVIWCIADALIRFDRKSWIAAAGAVIIVAGYSGWERRPLPLLPWRSIAWRVDRGEAVSIVVNPSSLGDVNPYAVNLPAIP